MKAMEHIIYSNIMKHLESNAILSDMQFGFRKQRSADLQLLQTIHDLAFNLDHKSQTDRDQSIMLFNFPIILSSNSFWIHLLFPKLFQCSPIIPNIMLYGTHF